MEKDAKLKEQYNKKLKEGWIQSIMAIEVLAVNKGTAKTALEKHVQSMEKEKRTLIAKKDFKEGESITNPIPGVLSAWSYIVELEVLTVDFDTLVKIVVNYGPASVEILSPKQLKLDMGEAQAILNSMAELVHKYAAAGLGGIMVKT